ncbi:hypothetical protein [Janthinobacterium sp. SUN033]|uniref:hypothetical protein n=1 Tax=Janthinobacterium sp. SUN033 TaxID=3002439 RepID=UPI0025B03973|nr:hypothetical protein [Janthinobacterium sp. SUN033]MDN2676439.1 hypothetical protein [Janthinobacterium sp. SUN033]
MRGAGVYWWQPQAQAADKAAPQASSGARQVKVKPADTANLVSHLRRVITDETNDTPPRVLNAFVAKYQQRALDAGIDDLDRQTQIGNRRGATTMQN